MIQTIEIPFVTSYLNNDEKVYVVATLTGALREENVGTQLHLVDDRGRTISTHRHPHPISIYLAPQQGAAARGRRVIDAAGGYIWLVTSEYGPGGRGEQKRFVEAIDVDTMQAVRRYTVPDEHRVGTSVYPIAFDGGCLVLLQGYGDTPTKVVILAPDFDEEREPVDIGLGAWWLPHWTMEENTFVGLSRHHLVRIEFDPHNGEIMQSTVNEIIGVERDVLQRARGLVLIDGRLALGLVDETIRSIDRVLWVDVAESRALNTVELQEPISFMSRRGDMIYGFNPHQQSIVRYDLGFRSQGSTKLLRRVLDVEVAP